MDYNGQKRKSDFRSEMRCDQRDLYSSAAVDDNLQIKAGKSRFFSSGRNLIWEQTKGAMKSGKGDHAIRKKPNCSRIRKKGRDPRHWCRNFSQTELHVIHPSKAEKISGEKRMDCNAKGKTGRREKNIKFGGDTSNMEETA